MTPRERAGIVAGLYAKACHRPIECSGDLIYMCEKFIREAVAEERERMKAEALGLISRYSDEWGYAHDELISAFEGKWGEFDADK